MSLFMALTGTENASLRSIALALSLSLLVMAVLSGRMEMVVLHLGLVTLHVMRLQAQGGLGGPALAPVTRDSR